MPGHDERDFLAAEAWLRRAMAMDPNDMYAAYYLGCLYFEYARPDQAIAILSQIPRTFFSSFDQEWRDIKRREIILSCRMMRREAIDGQEIQDIIRIHQTNPAEEVWPLPEELVSTTVKVFTDAPDSQRTRELAGLVIEELERAGLAEVYADEIHRIRRLIDS
jgi:tetratricopeptide (TPR) repeat protein